jgi:hypothetical protein
MLNTDNIAAGDIGSGDEVENVNSAPLQMGPPSPAVLAKINKLTGQTWEASDWFCYSVWGSDTLVDRGFYSWSEKISAAMANTYEGAPLMYDHSWGVAEGCFGFVVGATRVQLPVIPEDMPQTATCKGANEEIAASGKFYRTQVDLAVRSTNTEIIDRIKTRALNACSTGGKIYNAVEICPHCEVPFFEKDKAGEYICPHLPNDWFYKLMFGDDPDVLFSDYVILDGDYQSCEMSMVPVGALPGAEVIR